MVCERSVLRIFRVDLGFTDVLADDSVAKQLHVVGHLTERALQKALKDAKSQLTPHEKAEIHTVWLREQRPSNPQIKQITDEYCRFLHGLKLSAKDVLDTWDSCTKHVVESFDPAQVKEKEAVLQNISKMRADIRTRMLRMKSQDEKQKPPLKKEKAKAPPAPAKRNKVKTEPDLATRNISAASNRDPGPSLITETAKLPAADAVSSMGKFGPDKYISPAGGNRAAPQSQNRDKENARLNTNPQGPKLTGANSEPTTKVHPMFRIPPRLDPLPPPSRNLHSEFLKVNAQPRPWITDLTEQKYNGVSFPLQNNSQYRSPAPLIFQDDSEDSEDEMGNLRKGYVCKRCNVPGHHIKNCPKLYDQEFDSQPDPEYECHACGQKGDHFITSCKERKSGYSLKRRVATIGLSENDYDDQSYKPKPSDVRPWTETGFNNLGVTSKPTGTVKPGRKTSGHGRKRSDDVEFFDERRKRSKTSVIDSYKPAARNQSSPGVPAKELKVRKRLPKEGRLSPWTTDRDDDVDMGIPPPFVHQVDTLGSPSRYQPPGSDHRGNLDHPNAEIETDRFLEDLAIEQKDKRQQRSAPDQTGFPSLDGLPSGYDLAVRSGSREYTSEETRVEKLSPEEVSSNDAATDPGSPRELSKSDEFDDHVMTSDSYDEPSSPFTPRTPPAIEFGVTPKSLFSPNYDLRLLALFQRVPNVWIRKASRRTALKMWPAPQGTGKQQEPSAGEGSIEASQDKRIVHSTEASVVHDDPSAVELSPAGPTLLEDIDAALDTMVRR